VGRRQVVGRGALDHLEGREQGATGFAEIEHHPVAEPLHRSAPMFLGGPSDQGGELVARSAAASSPRSSVSRVYPVISRKQIAGGRCSRLNRPARSNAPSTASANPCL
jgi:hypothetical protein